MSYPCDECGNEVHLTRWVRTRVSLKGLWPGSVETGVTTCPMCGHDSFRAEASFGRIDTASDHEMRLSTLGRYRCPVVPMNILNIVYFLHPLPTDSNFHTQAVKHLDDHFNPDTTFLVTEERFGVVMEQYVGGWEVPNDLAVWRTGPYANMMVEWAVSNYALTHLGKPRVQTLWPSYFRPNFEYIQVVADEDLFRTWVYDFRRRLPIEIKVNQ